MKKENAVSDKHDFTMRRARVERNKKKTIKKRWAFLKRIKLQQSKQASKHTDVYGFCTVATQNNFENSCTIVSLQGTDDTLVARRKLNKKEG